MTLVMHDGGTTTANPEIVDSEAGESTVVQNNATNYEHNIPETTHGVDGHDETTEDVKHFIAIGNKPTVAPSRVIVHKAWSKMRSMAVIRRRCGWTQHGPGPAGTEQGSATLVLNNVTCEILRRLGPRGYLCDG